MFEPFQKNLRCGTISYFGWFLKRNKICKNCKSLHPTIHKISQTTGRSPTMQISCNIGLRKSGIDRIFFKSEKQSRKQEKTAVSTCS